MRASSEQHTQPFDNPAAGTPASVATGIARRHDALSRSDAFFVIVLVLLSALSWYPRRQGALDLRWDGSVYYVLGTSLAQGSGYHLLNEPGQITANQYPPLLPLIVAAHQRLLGSNDAFAVGSWLKLSYIVCSTFVMIGTFLLCRKFLPPAWAKIAAVLYVINLPSYMHFSMLAAELPFTAAVVGFLLVNHEKPTLWRQLVAGAAALVAFLSRTVGIVLFAAWIGDALMKRQFRSAALRTVAALLCVAPWYMYVHRVEASFEYQHPTYPYQRSDYLYYNVSYARNMAYVDPYRPELGKASLQNYVERIARPCGGTWFARRSSDMVSKFLDRAKCVHQYTQWRASRFTRDRQWRSGRDWIYCHRRTGSPCPPR